VRHRFNKAHVQTTKPLNHTKEFSGSYGIDISGQTCDGASWISATQFPCFRSAGKSFALIQTMEGGYGYTTSIKYCASQAAAAGLSVSLYAFMCPNCNGNTPAYNVALGIANRLTSEGVAFDYIYVDVEQCSGCWNGAAENVAFLQDVVRGFTDGGAKVAIYSSAYEWGLVCGSDSSLSNLPLWYPHYDGVAAFSDFAAFGGWTSPVMKQYSDHSDAGCFDNVDVNWQP